MKWSSGSFPLTWDASAALTGESVCGVDAQPELLQKQLYLPCGRESSVSHVIQLIRPKAKTHSWEIGIYQGIRKLGNLNHLPLRKPLNTVQPATDTKACWLKPEHKPGFCLEDAVHTVRDSENPMCLLVKVVTTVMQAQDKQISGLCIFHRQWHVIGACREEAQLEWPVCITAPWILQRSSSIRSVPWGRQKSHRGDQAVIDLGFHGSWEIL